VLFIEAGMASERPWCWERQAALAVNNRPSFAHKPLASASGRRLPPFGIANGGGNDIEFCAGNIEE
jgi:hypothetical protein